jgi:hypothetical protein
MKLTPPILLIPPDKPYQNDLFGREDFGRSLTSLFSQLDENIVLCVDAPWGEGKTSFANMWKADLKNRGRSCIYFDAYEHDYSDDPFISFCAAIISLVESDFKKSEAIQSIKEDFKTKAIRIGGKLLSTGTRIGAKAITLGIIKDSDIDSIESIRSDLADSASTALSNYVSQAIDDYSVSHNSLDEFRKRLSKLAAAVKKEQMFPLLIIVDELDRCRPDFALSLIERIKHLFSASDVSFLLLVNSHQLQNYVRRVYGAEVDAINYLHKFFTLMINLPQNRVDSTDNDHAKYFTRLVQHYEIGGRPDFGSLLIRLFQHYEFSLREMERCMASLALYFSQLPDRQFNNDDLVAFLAIIRFKFPQLFIRLITSSVTYTELVKITEIDKVERTDYTRFPKDWLHSVLQFCLMSKSEYEALDPKNELRRYERWLFHYNLERKQIIPFLCSELMKFRTKEI